MSRPKILIVAAEAAPFARTGGLGDVIGALPVELARLGHEVAVCIPHYQTIDDKKFGLHDTGKRMAMPEYRQTAELFSCQSSRDRLTHYFIGNDKYFGRPSLYVDPSTGVDYTDNDERFAFFARAVLRAIKQLEFKPDVIHVHDWQAAMVLGYLRSELQHDPFYADMRTVLTIHNIGYQGLFEGTRFASHGLPDEFFYAMTGPFEFFGQMNFLKGAIVLADKITTVSSRYAQEIQTDEEFGFGLQDVLSERSQDLVGILNGVDYSTWSPSRDKHLKYRFKPANLSGKRANKVELLGEAGLPLREKTPLVGMVTRLAEQKGIDLVIKAAAELLALPLQLIILGTGDKPYEEALQKLELAYPDQVKVYLQFSDRMAHLIEAGSDMFLMPSRYEPCGLNQMYSLKYGTVPVVREVGGLADTVTDYSEQHTLGTGFVFADYTAEAMLTAMQRAVQLYPQRRKWTQLMKTGMREDFSWRQSAAKYAELYEQARSAEPIGKQGS